MAQPNAAGIGRMTQSLDYGATALHPNGPTLPCRTTLFRVADAGVRVASTVRLPRALSAPRAG